MWEDVGSWSGQGSRQNGSFNSDTGVLRIRWETKLQNPGTQHPAPGTQHPEPPPADTFRLTIHSAISGRPLMVAVDQKGVGAGTTFVSEDPRVFFTEVVSEGLDWSFTIQERLK